MTDRYQITFESWNNVASAYEAYFMDLDLYNDTYDTFCQLIDRPDARVLEIGCDPGNISRYLLRQRPHWRLLGIDVAPNMIALAQVHNPTAEFEQMDCRDIASLTPGYEGIVCGFCLPYLAMPDCEKLLDDCSHLLLPDGLLYLSTIEGPYQRSGYETGSNSQHQMYVYYYPEDYLQHQLSIRGLQTLDLVRKTFEKKTGELSTHLIWIARKTPPLASS